MKENSVKNLLKLIKENPELPILPMVDYDVVCDDSYTRWMGSIGKSYVDEYVCVRIGKYSDENVFWKDDVSTLKEDLWENYSDLPDFKDLSDDELDSFFDKIVEMLPWKKAICVNIDCFDGDCVDIDSIIENNLNGVETESSAELVNDNIDSDGFTYYANLFCESEN